MSKGGEERRREITSHRCLATVSWVPRTMMGRLFRLEVELQSSSKA